MFLPKALIITSFYALLVHAVNAEPLIMVETSSTTLSQLTQNVLSRQLSSEIELARQKEVVAGRDLANSWLSGDPSFLIWHRNDAVGSGNGFREWEGSFVLPLWLSGQKQGQENYTQQMVQEIPAFRQQLLLTASGQVRAAIWEVKVAEVAAQSSLQNWESAERLEKDVANRVRIGDMAPTEELLAKTNTLSAHGRYLTDAEKLGNSLTNYKLLTGEKFLPTKIEETIKPTENISEKHPVLAMLSLQIATLKAAQNLARYDGAETPSVLVGAHTEQAASGAGYDNSISLGINIPFSNDALRAPAITGVGRALTEAEVERLQIHRKLEQRLTEAHHSLDTQKQQLVLAKEQKKIADQYLNVQQQSFKLGEIDLLTLIGTQIIANQSRAKKDGLEITVQQAIARVNQAAGVAL